MDCNTCKERQKQAEPVPYIVHEGAMARAERAHKRQTVIIIILLLALILTNAAWIWYESQFVYEEITQEVDTGEGDAFVAGIGDINYGESTADSKTPNP